MNKATIIFRTTEEKKDLLNKLATADSVSLGVFMNRLVDAMLQKDFEYFLKDTTFVDGKNSTNDEFHAFEDVGLFTEKSFETLADKRKRLQKLAADY